MKLCDSKSFTVKKFIIYSAWCHCLSFKLFQSPFGGGACYFSHTLIRSVSFSSTHLLKIVMTTSTFINIIFSIYAITIRWEKKTSLQRLRRPKDDKWHRLISIVFLYKSINFSTWVIWRTNIWFYYFFFLNFFLSSLFVVTNVSNSLSRNFFPYISYYTTTKNI